MLSLLIHVLAAGFLLANPVQSGQTKTETTQTEIRNGKKYIVHTVAAKENFYSVARKYKVPVQLIKQANPETAALKIGQLVYIPAPVNPPKTTVALPPVRPAKAIPAAKAAVQPSPARAEKSAAQTAPLPASARTFSVDEEGKKWHTVAPGQTLYSLSNLFEIPVEELQKLNDLKTTDVRAGQVLLVGRQYSNAKPNVGQYVPEKDDQLEASNSASVAVKTVEASVPEPAAKPEPESKPVEIEGANRINETGLASVINQQLKSNKLLALHRSAPIGTVLQVKNSMNGRTVFVRVIGQLPDTGENDKVIVKISRKAYQSLGALDARFLAEVSYLQ